MRTIESGMSYNIVNLMVITTLTLNIKHLAILLESQEYKREFG
jgi:hypothetical protein